MRLSKSVQSRSERAHERMADLPERLSARLLTHADGLATGLGVLEKVA
jgi:hypothetical protein